MAVVGAVEVMVTPVTTGFDQKLKQELAPAYGNAAKTAEKEGEKVGSAMGGGMGAGLKKEGSKLASLIEGVTGVPLNSFKQKLGGMEKDLEKAGGSAEGFGAKLATVAKGGVLAVAAAFAVVGVASLKAADEFDVADQRFRAVVGALHENYKKLEGSVEATDNKMVHLGFTTTETHEALGTLALSAKSTGKAENEMGVAADLARFKHIGLAEAAQILTKVNAGNNRALLQLGINLDLGNAKLSAVVKATEAAKKAKENLKVAETELTEAVKKGAEEHKAALEKVSAAEDALHSAQDTLKGGSEGVTSAQEALRQAQRGVAETARHEADEVRNATKALKDAEAAARQTAIEGAKSVEEAKKGVADIETERAKESNEAQIKTIEGEEKVAESIKGTAGAQQLATLKAKKAALEATDAGIEQTKKDEQLAKARKNVTEQETTAHKNNKTALTAVAAAHAALREKQKEALKTSKESVGAAERVTAAQRGVAAAERTLASDQAAVGKAMKAVADAQKEAAATSPAVIAAEAKVAKAHEALSKANETLAKDGATTQRVMQALAEYLHGQASAYTETLAGKMAVLKAEVNKAEVAIGEKLMPVVIKMVPTMKMLATSVAWVAGAVADLLGWWQKGWEKMGQIFFEHEKIFKTIFHDIVHTLISIATMGIYPLVKAFKGGFGGILHYFLGLPMKFLSVAKAIGEAIWEGMKWGIDKVAEGLEDLLHAIGLPGFHLGPIHFKGIHPFSSVHIPRLAEGGIVDKPTIAMIGEAGREAVVPLDRGARRTGMSHGAGGAGGFHMGDLHIHGSNMNPTDVVRELAWGARTGKLRFATT